MRRCIGVVAGATLVMGSIVGLTPSSAGGATSAGTISVLAGSGTQGFVGNGTAVSSADFFDPSDEAVTSGGTYIADMKNCQVREVTGGTIAAFAGVGGCVTPNTNMALVSVPGPAASATIGMPTGLAVDASGTLYVADCIDYTGTGSGCQQGDILEISGGAISVLLTAAQIGAAWGDDGAPWGVRVQGGQLYFSDVVNNVVDRVSTSGGAITTVAGDGAAGSGGDGGAATSAQLDDPTGIAVDGSGDVFIADSKNARVREVTAANGDIVAFAGNGVAGTSGDGGAAAAAELSKPFGVAEDGAGNVYIADFTAFCVREVSGGTISTFAGTCGTSGYDVNGVRGSSALFGGLSSDSPPGGPSQVVLDGGNNLIVNDYGDNQVDVVALQTLTAPSTPTITNLPGNPSVGQSFVATVSTNGDGTRSVSSSTTGVCTVTNGGLTVDFVGAGTCALTAKVTAGTAYQAATGSTQGMTVVKATPTTPTVTNIPSFAQVGHGFVATVSTNGDGVTSVVPNSPAVCKVAADGHTVSFVASGICSLTAQVAAGQTYGAATGLAQTFLVNPVTGPTTPTASQGYWLVATDGGIFNYGDAGFFGSAGSVPLNKPIVGMAATPDGKGYWLVASDGGVFNYGDAGFFGSAGSVPLNKPIVGMAPTATGKGYWLVATDGGIFNYGDAGFFGSAGSVPLNKPIVGMAASPTGKGYWLVASDGGIFNYGDAGFYGSTGSIQLNRPIVGMAATPAGKGYWLVASDGGIFNYGDAGFYGSAGSIPLNQPIWGVAATHDGKGYWLVAIDGGIFNYGDAGFFGSTGGLHRDHPVVGITPSS